MKAYTSIKKYLKAMCLIIFHQCKSDRKDCFGFIFRSAKFSVKSITGRKSEFYNRRIRACNECCLFDKYLGTCGTPGDDMGCKCVMSIAARWPEKTCWINDLGIEDIGWTASFNEILTK